MFGGLGHLGLGKEVTWGTPVAATEYVRFINESINEEIEQRLSEGIDATVDEGDSFEGARTIAGDLTAEVYPTVIGHLLRAAFGAPVTTALDAPNNVYQHVFTPVQANFSAECALPPYSIEVHRDAAQAFQYAGAVVNDLMFSFGTDTKIMQATAAIIAKKLALIAKTTPSFETTKPFTWNQATVTIGGAANADCQTAEFGVNNNLEGRFTIDGTRDVSRIWRNGLRRFPVNLTFDLKDLTEYNRFRAQSENAAKIEFIGDTIFGANKFKLTVDIPKLRYESFPINVGGAEVITAQVNGVAKYDAATTAAMKITLVNTKISY